MKRLSETEFKATFGSSMTQQGRQTEAPFDFWPYFNSLPEEEFCGFDYSGGVVDRVYRDSSGRYEHVLINSENKNVFLVIVLDLKLQTVHGHHQLNLLQ